MSYRVRFTRGAEDDLVRLYQLIPDRDPTDWALAERALEAIRHAISGLERTPFSYRKTAGGSTFLRELVIFFGSKGCVALFEIESDKVTNVLAVRHQREDDYLQSRMTGGARRSSGVAARKMRRIGQLPPATPQPRNTRGRR